MAKSAADNSIVRLKTVLDVLAEGTWSENKLNAGEVLAEAASRVPFSAHESELLSGGIPRGHKALTAATARLVKAGWLVKGRSGWTITEDGLRATVAFAKPEAFATALAEGTPVPEGTPLPEAPKKKPAAKRAPAKTAAKTPAKDAAKEPKLEQPSAVAVAGDFSTLLGAPEDWAPQYDEVQMKYNARKKLWSLTADLPAGFYTYKIALNRSWDENYGAFGVRDGVNHELKHDGGKVTFTYSHATRDIVAG
ncbi:glycosidase [Arthrobacter sp. SW1]|uniref:pullulanase X25 domain-containing protein n=1 Tax=Arthrobacter sp. SW1 TaxID=1920889 RepID=UPI000877CE4B|nr:glycosidase [Arthrobacter sp. SW1]OFI37644.1 glycosidase [Arthrobacter sp. SW1]